MYHIRKKIKKKKKKIRAHYHVGKLKEKICGILNGLLNYSNIFIFRCSKWNESIAPFSYARNCKCSKYVNSNSVSYAIDFEF